MINKEIRQNIEKIVFENESKEKPQKKLSASQKRNLVYLEIEKELENQDFDMVREILSSNPNTEFTSNTAFLDSLEEKVIKNFDFNTAMALQERGMVFRPELLADQVINGRKNIELLDFIFNHYKACEKSNVVNRGKLIVIQNICHVYLKETPKNIKNKLLSYRDYIIKNNQLREKMADELTSSGIMGNIIKDIDKNLIDNFKEDIAFSNNEKGMGKFFTRLEHCFIYDKWNINQVSSFLFLYENVDEIKKAADNYFDGVDQDGNKKRTYKEFVDDYVGKGIDYKDSKIYELMSKDTNEKTATQMSMWMDDKQFELLGLKTHDKCLIYGRHWWWITHRSVINDINSKYELKYRHQTFDELIISNASDATNAYFESDEGQNIIYNAITSNVKIRTDWCKNVTGALISKTIKHIEELKTWKDENENNLGHYLIIHASKTTGTIQAIARANHEWFYEENNKGYNLIHLMKKVGYKPNQIIAIEKDILKRSLKSGGLKKRSKPKGKKRSL